MSRPRTTTRLRAGATAVACVAALGFAACGDDEETTTTTTTTTEATDSGSATGAAGGSVRELFNEQLLGVLTTQQGLSEAQAQCAIDELESSVSDEELEQALVEAGQTGEPPQDLIDAGFEAGQACADE